jgi:hypothetical protein
MQRHDAPQLKGRRAYVPYQQLNTRRHSPAMPLAPRQPPAAVWFVRTRTLALLLHSTEFYTSRESRARLASRRYSTSS